MVYLYKDLLKEGYSDYKIKKAVEKNEIFMIDKGIYSNTKDYNYIEVISVKHDNAILTLGTAAYCYGLTKKIPEIYCISTKQKDRKINDNKIKQIFMSDNLYNIGHNKVKYLGFSINIYDLERLLIEIVRNKKTIDFDLYKEIILSYKRIIKLVNKNRLNEYIKLFKDPKIQYRIEKEILI